jgi:hypothetical protein
MAIIRNCQPEPCDDSVSIREWLAANPPPKGGAITQQLDWLVGYLRAYACACGCGEAQVNESLQQLLQFFQNLRCPDRPLPVQDCLSQQILDQLVQINENVDGTEPGLDQVVNTLNQVIDAINNINVADDFPTVLASDCDGQPIGEFPAFSVAGVVRTRQCPQENFSLDQVDLGSNQTATIPANVKSYTVTVLQGTGSINGVGNLPQGFSIKGGGYSDGSRTIAPIQIAAGPASRVVAFWEF